MPPEDEYERLLASMDPEIVDLACRWLEGDLEPLNSPSPEEEEPLTWCNFAMVVGESDGK